MPDLDGELAELRTRLRETVHQPDLDTVIERSRQHGTRRRMQLGAVAAVLVVAAAIPVLRTTLGPVSDGPSPSGGGGTQPSALPPPAFPPPRYEVDFADGRHGFALRTRCTDTATGTVPECTNDLLITEDGGEHWQLRALAAEFTHAAGKPGIRLFALGPAAAAVVAIDPPEGRSFFTADAGRTWTPVRAAGSDTAATIPDGGLLDVACAAPANPDCKPVLIAVAPDTGRVLPLATKPPLDDPFPASSFPIAGGWWVSGKDPATGHWALAVSRDAGRSWSVKPLPNEPGTTRYVLMSAHGTTMYAAAGGELPNDVTGLSAIYRSVDGGNTWEQTFVGRDGRQPHSLVGYPVAAADGQLIISTGGGSAWASQDGGHNFSILPSDVISGAILLSRGGYLASIAPGMSNVYKISTDGVRWKEITVG